MVVSSRSIRTALKAVAHKFGIEISRYHASSESADLAALKRYEETGGVPWSVGYNVAHDKLIADTLNNSDLMVAFANRKHLPDGYGVAIDERCVEIPWVFANLRHVSGRILDAGSSLNYAFLIDRLLQSDRKLDIVTLAPEPNCFAYRGVGYLFEDLRALPIVDDHYDCVVCVSTLEHVGFDNSSFTKRDIDKEKRSHDYLKAVTEMFRVLQRGGSLLITVPYGRYQDVGAFQQFSRREIRAVSDAVQQASHVEVGYFKIQSTGAWDIAAESDCADCESVHWIMASKNERSETFPVHEDKAASARAVACLRITK